MNKPFFCFAALASVIVAHAASSADESGRGVASVISAVTVYPDRAVVTRTAALDLAAGTQEIVFAGLPATLVDQSLQVSGRGTAAATILDVSARQTFVNFTPNERVKALEDELHGLQKQFRLLDDRVATLNEQRAFVQRMLTASTGQIIYPLGATPTAGGGTPARPTLDEWQKLYAYSEETFGKIVAELQSIDGQREELYAKKTALDKQLGELRGAGGRAFKTVTVRVATASAGSLQLALAYTVPGASWTPAYDARLHSAERAIELTYFGIVRQNTGEDWKDIALTLSTARPSLGGGAPELPAWIVDVMRAQNKVAQDNGRIAVSGIAGSRQLLFNQAASAAPAVPALYEAADEKDAGYSAAAVQSGVTSATFKIATASSVPSNNSTQKVAIATVKLPASLQYQATPKLLEAAFLSAYAVNSTDYPLLGGAMNTFLDDVFVAASSLKTVMPGEKFELALGADEAIAIKRRLVQRFNEDTGLTNSGKRVTYEFLVTLTNNKKTAERVVFKEPLPVSRDEKIAVKLLTPAERDVGTADKPREATREADGKLVWRLDLKPGERREVPLKFSVEYPNEVTVTGLE
ncbi:MAG: mucoidy inhibitor MuiA family protein [Pseudomonadota bacterium]